VVIILPRFERQPGGGSLHRSPRQQSLGSNSGELIIVHKVAETEELEIWSGNDIYSVGCEILTEIRFFHKY